MRILKFLLGIVLILSGVFIAGGFFIPAEWTVSQTAVINASPEQIYPFVSDFKQWEKWSPWSSAKDATIKYTYEGPETGAGAKQSWTSEHMGNGWMQFTSANPKTGVSYDLFIDMGRSKSTLQGTMKFSSEGGMTRVLWTDKGNSGDSFIKRWISLLLKPMLGKDLDTGLAGLKERVEKKVTPH